MIQEIVQQVAVPVATAVVGWILARKKSEAEIQSLKLDNEIKSAKYYQSLLDDLTDRLQKALEGLAKCEDRYRDLMKVNRKLTAQNADLIKANKDLIEELRKFKQLNGKGK